MGGLATAALAQRLGLRTALLEAHTKLGGCAGYFTRGPYTFDAGATAIMGLGHGEPIGELLALLGVDFEGVRTPSYRVHLPDRVVDIVPDAGRFEALFTSVIARSRWEALRQRLFWRLQAAVGDALFAAAAKVPRLPARGPADLAHDLRVLGLPGVLSAATSLLTV